MMAVLDTLLLGVLCCAAIQAPQFVEVDPNNRALRYITNIVAVLALMFAIKLYGGR